LTLESGNEFGTHEVTLQYHFQMCKRTPQRANVRLTELLAATLHPLP
jgi:hypothetical protein